MTLPLFDQIFSGPVEGSSISGETLKEWGQQDAVNATPEEYRNRFIEIVKGLPFGLEFTVEVITEICGRPPSSNAVGGLISQCAKQGLIESTGRMVKAKRVGMHATLLMSWRRK